MPANAAIYIPYQNVQFGAVFGDDKINEKQGAVDITLTDISVRFNLMSKDGIEEHVNSFINYIQTLDVAPDRIDDAIVAIRQTKSVLGLETDMEFEEYPEIWESLFRIAKHFDGYVFSYDSLMLPSGGVIFGPLLNES